MSKRRRRIWQVSFLAGPCLLLCACGGMSSSSRPALAERGAVMAALDIVTSELPAGIENTGYQAWIKVSDATFPGLTFALGGGGLPPGLFLDPGSGAVSGVPVETGTFAFIATVSATGALPVRVSRALQISVNARLGPTPPIPRILPARTQGVAPLAVFLDATGSSAGQTTRPFHELQYTWAFCDPQSSRQGALGPVATHVFERPGVYQVKLTVRDSNGSAAFDKTLITVQDPDEVFAGTRTLCFATTDDFSGAPGGAKNVVTSSFDTVMQHAAAGRRLLLRRGDTFTAGAGVSMNWAGPFHLGAFGAGTNPDARGIFANNPVVLVPGSSPILRPAGKDHRVTDLTFRASAPTPGTLFEAAYRVEQFLMARLRLENFKMAACIHHDLIQYYKIDAHDQVTVKGCVFLSGAGNCIYTGGTRLALLDNEFRGHGGDQSHLLRITFADKALISGNSFSGTTGTRHCLKLHGPTWPAFPLYSQKILISENMFDSAVSWLVALGPQNSSSDERVRELIVERNTFRPAPGARVCLYLNSSATTIRNNVFQDVQGAPAGDGYICVDRRGIEPIPAEVAIWHNTAYCDHDKGNELTFATLALHQGAPIQFKNNLLFAPRMARVRLIRGDAPVALAANLIPLDPRFACPALGDFSLLAGSPAIDAGVEVPVWDDFEGSARPALDTLPDVGAYEHH